jgi:acetyltransferase-like isoleucine patch superfamily enzyme
MRNIWFLIDRIKEKLLGIYRTKVFYAHVRDCGQGLKILGKIDVRATNVKIGNNVTIYPGVMFWGNGEIVVGDNVDIGKDTIIFARKSVVIGNDVAIAAQCYIIDSNHGTAKGSLIRSQPQQTEGIQIGNDVWLAAGVKVLKGGRILDGAVIGALSLVNSEIPENAIAFGIPAKIKSFRVGPENISL